MAAKIGGSGGDKHTIEQTADINITPFIDILLVLMIIFMVAAPMATVSIRLDLPPAQPPTNPTEEKEPVYITIRKTVSCSCRTSKPRSTTWPLTSAPPWAAAPARKSASSSAPSRK